MIQSQIRGAEEDERETIARCGRRAQRKANKINNTAGPVSEAVLAEAEVQAEGKAQEDGCIAVDCCF